MTAARLLQHQLKLLNLSEDQVPPNAETWGLFLKQIEDSYAKAYQERHLLEKSMTDSSRELIEKFESTRLSEEREQARAEVMTAIANNTPLIIVLNMIIKKIEESDPLKRCAVLLVDRAGDNLYVETAPNLPESYHQVVDGLKIQEPISACGRALLFGKRIVVENLASDPFAPLKPVAAEAQLQACWSQPIVGAGIVLGSFVIFLKESRRPGKNDLILLESAAQLASIALQHEQATELITEQRKNIIAKAKMAALGEMAGGVAHEINNPLSIILGKASLLKHHIHSSPAPDMVRIVSDLGKIEQTVSRISKIVNGLSTFSRSAENDPFESVSLKNLIEDTLELCRENLNHHHIELRVRIENEDLAYLVEGRSAQLSQILLNVLNNAADAVAHVYNRWIEIRLYARGGHNFIAVTDCGTGIAPEIVEKLMQPFFTTKETGKGTGLGLSISKGLVEGHHGRLYYELYQGNTNFVIELPSADYESLAVDFQPEFKKAG